MGKYHLYSIKGIISKYRKIRILQMLGITGAILSPVASGLWIYFLLYTVVICENQEVCRTGVMFLAFTVAVAGFAGGALFVRIPHKMVGLVLPLGVVHAGRKDTYRFYSILAEVTSGSPDLPLPSIFTVQSREKNLFMAGSLGRGSLVALTGGLINSISDQSRDIVLHDLFSELIKRDITLLSYANGVYMTLVALPAHWLALPFSGSRKKAPLYLAIRKILWLLFLAGPGAGVGLTLLFRSWMDTSGWNFPGNDPDNNYSNLSGIVNPVRNKQQVTGSDIYDTRTGFFFPFLVYHTK